MRIKTMFVPLRQKYAQNKHKYKQHKNTFVIMLFYKLVLIVSLVKL